MYQKIAPNCRAFLCALLFSLVCAGPLAGEEPVPDGEPAPGAQAAAGGETAGGESVPAGEPVISGETSGGENVPADGPVTGGESEPVIGGETPAGGEVPALSGEQLFSDDFDGAFVFEAPPLIFETIPFGGTRSFSDIYPNLSRSQRRLVMSSEGGLRYAFEAEEAPTLLPDPDAKIDLYSKVMARKPSHIVEALVLAPYEERELDFLDIYNALGQIGEIQNQEVLNRSGRNINTFEETTRLNNARSRRPIPDPPPREALPYSETIYVRFVDKYIGDLYIRGTISIGLYGIMYDMTNFRDVTFSLFSIMKAERFSAIIYLEPVKEGILIYSMSGIYLPGFLVGRVNLTPNMNRHVSVLLKWVMQGLDRESKRQRPKFYIPNSNEQRTNSNEQRANSNEQ